MALGRPRPHAWPGRPADHGRLLDELGDDYRVVAPVDASSNVRPLALATPVDQWGGVARNP
ncbi:hypothetical protein [Amycolatopsis sp. NPDC004169]|uniref:hypothetical protein n=1 Tax=Amycolatopsis sp. NPDC004169 TaxID=3154453 RepID=UPI0033BAA2A8